MHSNFVTEKVNEGVALGTMVICPCGDLRCMLPLGVAINAAGKLRLIWYGRHVNRHLPKRKFRMETLQREGRALFERSAWESVGWHGGSILSLPSCPHGPGRHGLPRCRVEGYLL